MPPITVKRPTPLAPLRGVNCEVKGLNGGTIKRADGTSMSYSHPIDHLYLVDRDRLDNSLKNDLSMSCEPEWIVTKQETIKPHDNLKLEGEMNLETTFRATIDSSAQRMMSSILSGSGNDNDGHDGHAYELPPKTSIIRKQSQNRPKTSLKPGGKGYFMTSNKETYKNFVIVDTSREKLVQDRLAKIVQESESHKSIVENANGTNHEQSKGVLENSG